jgi:hypothetical protein
MSSLAPCPRCRRLLRSKDAACPFCFAVRTVALAAILPLSVACQRGTTATDAGATAEPSATTANASPSTSAATAPSDTVAPLAPLAASATPSAIASVRQAAVGRDGGAADPQLLAVLSSDAGLGSILGDAGLATLGTINPGMAAYGGPPGPLLTAPAIGAYGGPPAPGVLAGNVSTTMGGAHTPTDDRVVATRRGAMRACYTRGLTVNPVMAGKLKLSVQVGAAGTATAVIPTLTSGNVTPDVQQCIATTLKAAVYEPSAHAFDVDVTLTKP